MQPMAANDSPGASLGLAAQAPTQCAPRQVFALAGAATVQTSRIVTPPAPVVFYRERLPSCLALRSA
jgi:hypothetical protein